MNRFYPVLLSIERIVDELFKLTCFLMCIILYMLFSNHFLTYLLLFSSRKGGNEGLNESVFTDIDF